MADKKRDILEFVEQSNFEQFTPTRLDDEKIVGNYWCLEDNEYAMSSIGIV